MDLILVERIDLEVNGKQLGILKLNRPDQLNPLDFDTVKTLNREIDSLIHDKRICTIAVTGTGRAFSAGGDMIKYMELFRAPDRFMDFLLEVKKFANKCQTAGKPVIGLINGISVAGGVEIMLSFDFSYAAKSAMIGDGHANFGLIGGGGANYRLPRRILPSHAFENLMTGSLWTAEEAARIGLVNKVVPDNELLNSGIEFANKMASKSPLGCKLVKDMFYKTLNMNESDAEYIEILVAHSYLTTSEDAMEGLRAFVEDKRMPKFKGK